MEWEFIAALALAVPVVLGPAAYVWYLNLGGIYAALRRKSKATREAVVVEHPILG
jgi:hypothetical protein